MRHDHGGAGPRSHPTATPWQEYLAAAQGLDAVHRAIAREAAAAVHQVSSARAELARTRARLGAQRQRLVAEALRAGVPVPPLDPTPDDQAWARSVVVDGPEAAPAVLRQSHALIDAADAQLVEAANGGGRSGVWLVVGIAAAIATVLLLCALVVASGLILR